MMLGENQRSTLQQYATMLLDSTEPAKLIIKIHPWRRYHRGPKGHPISIAYVYDSDGYEDLLKWISTCEREYTAIEKAKEIGRYICDDLGCSRAKVKIIS